MWSLLGFILFCAWLFGTERPIQYILCMPRLYCEKMQAEKENYQAKTQRLQQASKLHDEVK